MYAAEDDEDAHLAATLAALEGGASRDIAQLATRTLDNQAAFNVQTAVIRDGLAAVRSAMRELEALTEEQDTCACPCCCGAYRTATRLHALRLSRASAVFHKSRSRACAVAPFRFAGIRIPAGLHRCQVHALKT